MTKQFNFDVNDATNLSFAVQQASYIESRVVLRPYPMVTYARDIPVDSSANPFAASVTFFSLDNVGTARLVNGRSDDGPLANVVLDKWENAVRMGEIGYSFSLEAIGQAQMMGHNLPTMGADAARLAYEKFIDGAAFLGTGMPAGTTGLYNSAAVTSVAATGLWSGLTGDQILADLNTMLNGVYNSSLMVEMANTVRLPPAVFANIASKPRSSTSDFTVLQYIQQANVYTATTGLPLDIKGDKFLTTTACAYLKDPDVLKLHIPMPLQFLPIQPRNLEYFVPGMFRLAGLDIRRPGAMRYMSGVA